jgi:hypothetical protein
MRSVGLNEKIAIRIFITNRLGSRRNGLRLALAQSTPSRKAPSAWGADIVEGVTFTDAIGKAGRECSEERLSNGEEGALDG